MAMNADLNFQHELHRARELYHSARDLYFRARDLYYSAWLGHREEWVASILASDTPDAFCLTLPDGECVAWDCPLHNAKATEDELCS